MSFDSATVRSISLACTAYHRPLERPPKQFAQSEPNVIILTFNSIGSQNYNSQQTYM